MQPGSSATSNGSRTWRNWKDAPNRPEHGSDFESRGIFLRAKLWNATVDVSTEAHSGIALVYLVSKWQISVVLQTLFRSSKLCMSHPSSLASLSHRYFESLGRNIEEQADCQTRIEICWFWRGHKSEIKTETTWGFNPDGEAAVLQPPRNHTVSQT